MAVAAAMVALGMFYLLGWNALVHHSSTWATSGDLWGVFRGAHYVGWGYLGGVYVPTNGIISFPGIEIILAPVAMISSSLHLNESASTIFEARPTAALLLVPVELLLASTVVFAADAMARWLVLPRRRRAGLCCVVGAMAWPTAAVWGHTEDVLAITFAIYALLALFDGKWAKSGWLMGVGIVVQPLILLILPLVIASSPAGQRARQAFRSLAISATVLGVAFAGNFAGTYRAVVKQPSYPGPNHVTPWLTLAPRLASTGPSSFRPTSLARTGPGHVIGLSMGSLQHSIVVTGGAGRTVYLAIALVVGAHVWLRPQHSIRLLWLAAAILAARCFFEAVIVPYYLFPALSLAVILAARRSPRRFWGAVAIAGSVTVFSYVHLSPWLWWLPIVAGMSAVLVLAYPGDMVDSSNETSGVPGEGLQAVAQRTVSEPFVVSLP